MHIRTADPRADAAAVAEIYRPAVVESTASFEAVAPDPGEMASRMARTLEERPWLVAEGPDGVVGYAYATAHRARPAYRWSVEVSAYVAGAARGAGTGRALYDVLLALLRVQGFHTAYAGVTLPNPASEALHAAVGMRRFAVLEGVGWKLGAWRDVAWYALRLSEPEGPPGDPRPLGRLTPAELADCGLAAE